MYRNDLLYEVQTRARLYGRMQARRVVQAVVQALGEFLPEAVFVDLTAVLPADIDVPHPVGRYPVASSPGSASACRYLTRRVAARLLVDDPNATFFCRIVFGQLNTFCRGTTPEQIAAFLPADLRPLLTTHVHDPAPRYRQLMAALSVADLGMRRRGPHALADSTTNPVVEEGTAHLVPPTARRGTDGGRPDGKAMWNTAAGGDNPGTLTTTGASRENRPSTTESQRDALDGPAR